MNSHAAPELLRLALEEGHLPAAQLQEALERQVFSGGGLDTVLLEMGLLTEESALGLLGRCWSLPTVARSRWEHSNAAAVAVFPQGLAEGHGLCPLELVGRKLIVAARAPADVAAFEALLGELGFALSLYVRAELTTEPRLSWGLHRAYGLAIPPRHEALLAAWGEAQSTAAITSLPAPVAADADADPPSDISFDIDVESAGDETGWRWRSTFRHGTSTSAEPSDIPLVHEEDTSGWQVLPPGTGMSSAASSGAAPGLALIVDGTLGAPDVAAARLRDHLHQLERQEQSTELRRRQKVLWTVDDALAELALASTRDELLEVTLRFAWRRLSTAAVVVRQGNTLVVWDILDELLRSRELRRFPIDADADHALSRALRLRSPVLGPVDADDPYLRLLGRRPRALLILPILIGERCGGAVVGDNGERAVPPAALAELHMVVPRLGRALGNLILRARTAALPTPSPEPAGPRDSARPPLIVFGGGDDDALVDDLASRALQERPPLPPEDHQQDRRVEQRELPRAHDDDQATIEVGDEELEASRPSERGALSTPPHAGVSDDALAPSPGAHARESLLVATWRSWLAHAVVSADDDLDELVAILGADEAAALSASQQLVAAGPRSLLALARAFPGLITHHPFGSAPSSSAMLAAQAATPFFRTLKELGADAVAPILVGELDHDDRQHRFGAVVGLSIIDVPAALPRLAQRAFDAEQRLASLAIEVLGRQSASPDAAPILARLRDLCRRGDDFQRLRAVRAVAGLRDAGALPVLIDLLGARPRDVADEARAALVEITCQDFGTAERRWRAWFADHGQETRNGWLVDALDHKDVALRRAAAAALRDAGVELFGYRADAVQRDRDAASRAVADAHDARAAHGAGSPPTRDLSGPIARPKDVPP